MVFPLRDNADAFLGGFRLWEQAKRRELGDDQLNQPAQDTSRSESGAFEPQS